VFSRLRQLEGCAIKASDGELGEALDFYFDDRTWKVRYVVAQTGTWLAGRRVLLSADVLRRPHPHHHHLPVSLTTEQVRQAPGVSTDLPVSRQEETELAAFYGWGQYWQVYNYEPDTLLDMPPVPFTRPKFDDSPAGDPDLRSANELVGYHVQGPDDVVGYVDDFLVQVSDWHIRYLVVNPHHWLPERKILLTPSWIDSVDWADRMVRTLLTRNLLRNAPPYDPDEPLDARYQKMLQEYYASISLPGTTHDP